MLDLTNEQLGMLCELVPDFQTSPKGGRPPVSKQDGLAGIFWVMDNGSKWKDLPKAFGSKSSVHGWCTRWVKDGVFEKILHALGRFVKEQGRFRLYKCFVDGTFSKAKGGGDGIGCTKVGKRSQNHDPYGC